MYRRAPVLRVRVKKLERAGGRERSAQDEERVSVDVEEAGKPGAAEAEEGKRRKLEWQAVEALRERGSAVPLSSPRVSCRRLGALGGLVRRLRRRSRRRHRREHLPGG